MSKRNNNCKKHKTWSGILAFLLVLCVIAGIGGVAYLSKGFTNWDKFKKNDDTTKEEPTDVSESGAVVGNIESRGISLLSTKLSVDEYAANGVSEDAESAYTLTAMITPSDAANQLVDWSVEFADPTSEWVSSGVASILGVTAYVTVTPSSDGALTAVVENKMAFGEEIIVKCTSRDNPSAYATATLQYKERIQSYTIKFGSAFLTKSLTSLATIDTYNQVLDFSTVNAVSFSITYAGSDYTIADENSYDYITIKPTDSFKTALTNAGFNSSLLKEYSATNGDSLTDLWGSNWASALYSGNNTKKNKLISAIDGFTGNAYEIVLYTKKGGTSVATFYITFDASTIKTQKGVESVALDETEIVF